MSETWQHLSTVPDVVNTRASLYFNRNMILLTIFTEQLRTGSSWNVKCRDCLSVGAGSRFHCMLRAQEVLRQNVLTQHSAGTTGLYCTSQDVTVSTYWWFSLSCSTNVPCHESRVLQQCPRGLSLAKINQEVHLWRSCHSALSTHFKYAKNKLYK